MSARKIQIGQLWKKDGTGDTYLVTRIYTEALSTIALLRKSGAEDEDLIRVRVQRTPSGQNLPGFIPAVEDDSNYPGSCEGNIPGRSRQMDLTGSFTTSSTAISSFCRNGSPYFTPISCPWWRANNSILWSNSSIARKTRCLRSLFAGRNCDP